MYTIKNLLLCVFVVIFCFGYLWYRQELSDLSQSYKKWTWTYDRENCLNETVFAFNKVDSWRLFIDNISLWRPTKTDDQISDDRLLDQFAWMKKYSEELSLKNITKKSIIYFDTGVTSKTNAQNYQCPGFDFKFCNVSRSVDFKSPLEIIQNFDAALFSYIHRTKNRVAKLTIPKGVKQIIFTLESPFKAAADLRLNDAIFASYYWGSDIVVPYKKWLPYDMNNKSLFLIRTQTNQKNYADEKTKMAVIFVSNCQSVKNNRLGFVKELQKYISVDVYGRCGELQQQCLEKEDRTICMRRIIKQYKFYLAFENANCRDYITEKTFENALGNDAVPVVMGARPDDYYKVMPSNSYIHVEDYKSPEDLAAYLKFLNENDDRFNEYFQWKGTGEFSHSGNYFLCRLCGMLFYSDFISHPSWKYEKKHTWKDINYCLPNKRWYWHSK